MNFTLGGDPGGLGHRGFGAGLGQVVNAGFGTFGQVFVGLGRVGHANTFGFGEGRGHTVDCLIFSKGTV
jgi:hypothetical protein